MKIGVYSSEGWVSASGILSKTQRKDELKPKRTLKERKKEAWTTI